MFTRHLKLLFIFSIFFITSTSVAYAGTAYDLYKIYGITVPNSVETEKEKLKSIESILNQVEEELNQKALTKDMADEIKTKSIPAQLKISEVMVDLTYELDSIVQEIEDNKTAPISVLMDLDARYLDVSNKLAEAEDTYSLFQSHINMTEVEDWIVTEEDIKNKEIASSNVKVQETRVNNAIEYSEIGELGKYTHPIKNKRVLTSLYGYRIDPITRKGKTFHHGVDFSASRNTEAIAILNGTVLEVGSTGSGGNHVFIDHGNGIKTYYAHLTKSTVKEGQKIKAGDVVALTGNTGSRTTGPHLHFGLYLNEKSYDPSLILGR